MPVIVVALTKTTLFDDEVKELEIAKAMVSKGMDLELVASITGLSVKTLKGF